jgi:hypothetical protein
MSSLTPNVDLSSGVYTGTYYAITGAGGFEIMQGFDTITYQPLATLSTYDMTNAVQVKYDVRKFNEKLGLYKDSSNQYITETSYNYVSDTYPTDEITLSATEFIANMTTPQVISVGVYSTLYSDFVSYVMTYFGYVGGFTTLFSQAEQFNYNAGVFDASALINIINYTAPDNSGAYITDLSGTITISNITQLLRTAVDSNAFGNRSTTTGATSSDPSNNSNYGVADGFMAGDLIFCPSGTTITLDLGINTETFVNSINNQGVTNVASLTQQTNYSSGYFSQNTTASTSDIKRVLAAPLLIRLENMSTA